MRAISWSVVDSPKIPKALWTVLRAPRDRKAGVGIGGVRFTRPVHWEESDSAVRDGTVFQQKHSWAVRMFRGWGD